MLARALALFALVLLSGVSSVRAETAPVVLVTPLVYGTHMPGLGNSATKLAKLIKERSGGSLTARLEAARRRHRARRDPRQGLGRQGRCRVLNGELLGGQAPRRRPVCRLSLRPRRQDLSRLVRERQRPVALPGDVRPCRSEGACRALRLRRRRVQAAGSPRKSRARTTSKACACASSVSAQGSWLRPAPPPCSSPAGSSQTPSTRRRSTRPSFTRPPPISIRASRTK